METAKLHVVRFDAQDVIATSADPTKLTISNTGTKGDLKITYMGTEYTQTTGFDGFFAAAKVLETDTFKFDDYGGITLLSNSEKFNTDFQVINTLISFDSVLNEYQPSMDGVLGAAYSGNYTFTFIMQDDTPYYYFQMDT